MQNAQEFLAACQVDGLLIRVPKEQVDRNVYAAAKKSLESIGGKWKSNKWAFEYKDDPTLLFQQILGGSDPRKDFNLFETPKSLGYRMAQKLHLLPGDTLFEPNAGRGALIDAALLLQPVLNVYWCEIMGANVAHLQQKYGTTALNVTQIGDDFLRLKEYTAPNQFDKIIMNPPFKNNQDIRHVTEAWYFLKPGGRMSAIVSPHYTFASDSESKRFRLFLETWEAEMEEIEAGAFRESGTNIQTRMLTLEKPQKHG